MAEECSGNALQYDRVYRQKEGFREDATEFRFPIDANEDHTDFSQSYLYLRCAVVKPDGAALDADAAVAVVNNFGHAFVKEIEVYAQNERLLTHTDLAYRAHLEHLLSYGGAAQKSWGSLQGFYPDTHGKFDSTVDDENAGFKWRRGLCAGSREFEMFAKPVCFPFNLAGAMPNQINWAFVVRRNSDAFLLQCAAAAPAKVVVKEIYLRICHVKPLRALGAQMNRLFASGREFRMPYEQSAVETFFLRQGSKQFKFSNNLNRSARPTFLTMCVVDERAYNGDAARNPFELQHYNMQRVQVTSGDRTAFGGAGLEMNIGAGAYMRAFFELQKALGYLGSPDGMLITRHNFDNGLFVVCVNVRETLRDENGADKTLDPTIANALTVELDFRQNLAHNAVLLCVMTFDNHCVMHHDRAAEGSGLDAARKIRLEIA